MKKSFKSGGMFSFFEVEAGSIVRIRDNDSAMS